MLAAQPLDAHLAGLDLLAQSLGLRGVAAGLQLGDVLRPRKRVDLIALGFLELGHSLFRALAGFRLVLGGGGDVALECGAACALGQLLANSGHLRTEGFHLLALGREQKLQWLHLELDQDVPGRDRLAESRPDRDHPSADGGVHLVRRRVHLEPGVARQLVHGHAGAEEPPPPKKQQQATQQDRSTHAWPGTFKRCGEVGEHVGSTR